MKVELFYTPGCSECDAAQAALKVLAQDAVKNLDWRELNVLDALDYAVELGVLSLPSMAIDGVLVFSSLPTAKQLSAALRDRVSKDG